MWRNKNKDSHPGKVIRRKSYTPPTPPKQCDLVGINGSRTHFFSVKSAKRTLARIITWLEKRKSKDEPKQFTIVK